MEEEEEEEKKEEEGEEEKRKKKKKRKKTGGEETTTEATTTKKKKKTQGGGLRNLLISTSTTRTPWLSRCRCMVFTGLGETKQETLLSRKAQYLTPVGAPRHLTSRAKTGAPRALRPYPILSKLPSETITVGPPAASPPRGPNYPAGDCRELVGGHTLWHAQGHAMYAASASPEQRTPARPPIHSVHPQRTQQVLTSSACW